MSRRIDRINGFLRQELSQLLSRHVKDPRLSGVVSITQVDTSSDLRSAKVFLSVLGDDTAKQAALAGVQSAAAYLRHELRDRVTFRYVPLLSFVLDDSLERGHRLLEIMDRIREPSPTGPEPSSSSTAAAEEPKASAET